MLHSIVDNAISFGNVTYENVMRIMGGINSLFYVLLSEIMLKKA